MRGIDIRAWVSVGFAAAAVVLLLGLPAQAHAAPTLNIADAAPVPEPDAGTAPAVFTVTLSTKAKRTVKADYATATDPGEASTEDFAAENGTAVIKKGKRKTKISIDVLPDDLAEESEQFRVVLSNPRRAKLGDATGVGTITDDDEPALDLTDLTVPTCMDEGDVEVGTVSLSVPAPAGGTNVSLSASSANVTVPSSVTVPQGLTSGEFQISAVSAGTAEVTATLGATQIDEIVTVAAVSSPCATLTPHLVINEVDYDQAGTDTKSFVEIYNPTTQAVSLQNLALVGVSGGAEGTGTEYSRFALSAAGASLPAGGYLVVRNATVDVPLTALTLNVNGDWIQNGGSDALALIDTLDTSVMDAFSYEGGVTAATITGFPSPVDLTDGHTPSTIADTNTDLNSLARSPNGVDTDFQAADWILTSTITPGAANP